MKSNVNKSKYQHINRHTISIMIGELQYKVSSSESTE